jgi:hypothetical protein
MTVIISAGQNTFVPSAGTSTFLPAPSVRVSSYTHKLLRCGLRHGLNRAMHRRRVHHGPQRSLMEVRNQGTAPQISTHRTPPQLCMYYGLIGVSSDTCSTLVAQLNVIYWGPEGQWRAVRSNKPVYEPAGELRFLRRASNTKRN